jgi:methionyl-tRNA formyltransferase
MYNGEATAGVTIQLVNAGIDTGSIVQRGEVLIGRKSIGQVRRELEDLGLTLYVQAILDLKRGAARLIPQTGPRGKLYKDPRLADFAKFWWRQLRWRWHVASS